MARARGMRGVDNALRDLVRGMQTPVGAASRHALRPVLRDARRNLKRNDSVVSGEMQRSLTIRKDRQAPKMKPVYKVGPRRDSKRVRTVHLVEFGTAPHWQPKRNRWHPGARAKPFMRPAFDGNRDAAIQRYAAKLEPEIQKAARKVRRRIGEDR